MTSLKVALFIAIVSSSVSFAGNDPATAIEKAQPSADSHLAAGGATLSLLHHEPRTEPNHDMLFLLVDKTHLRADLKTWPEDSLKSETLMSFRIAIGKEEGDKQFEGDNKTPEGVYFAESILDGNSLPAKYGPKAIPINFPNPMDRILGKTGYGIWLHGVEKDQRVEAAKVTEGCVAFYNADIMTLTRWLKPHQSVVVIAKDAQEVNRPQDLASVRSATLAWADAWAKRNLDGYIGTYHNSFRYGGMSLDQYRTYKKRVFASYQDMKVETSDLRVFTHAKYAVSIMNQDFNGDNRYVSTGRKLLYWIKDESGAWKIYHESFENRRLEFPTFSEAEIAQIFENSPSAKLFNVSHHPTSL